jgi:hypothetical protein
MNEFFLGRGMRRLTARMAHLAKRSRRSDEIDQSSAKVSSQPTWFPGKTVCCRLLQPRPSMR